MDGWICHIKNVDLSSSLMFRALFSLVAGHLISLLLGT